MPPLTAGSLTSRLILQSRSEATTLDGAIVPTWTTYATIWGRKRAAGFAQQLESEQAAPRRAWEIDIRRPSTPLATPTRILHGDQTLFALVAVDNEEFRDQTLLHCVDGINMGLGELATIARATTRTRQADGSYRANWAPVAADVRIRMDDVDAALLQRLFGQEMTAHLHATVEIESDLRVGDGVTISSGRHLEQRYLVKARTIDPRLPAQAYFALALERTSEALS